MIIKGSIRTKQMLRPPARNLLQDPLNQQLQQLDHSILLHFNLKLKLVWPLYNTVPRQSSVKKTMPCERE